MCITQQVLASTYTGKISAIHVRNADGLVWIYVEGTRTGEVPTCGKKTYMIIKNENSESGKRQLALLMLAHATNKKVIVVGANTCTRWGDGEDIDTVSIWQD